MTDQPKKLLIDISILSFIKFFLMLLILIFLYLTREIIAVLFVALIFAAALHPWVDYLSTKKIPRALSVVFLFIVFIAFISLIIVLLVPAISAQVDQLAQNLPVYSEHLSAFINQLPTFDNADGEISTFNESVVLIRDALQQSAGSVFDTMFRVFGGLVEFFAMLVIIFYLLVEKNALRRATNVMIPDNYQEYFIDVVQKIQKKISAWFKGQFVLSLLIGLLVYTALLILGVEYALILALVAFIGEFVPYLGPLLASIPALLVAFVDSPLKALFVLIIFIIIQQAENHILVPKIMQRALGLNPIISIVALLIGAKLAGLVGLVLAIPVATALGVLAKEVYALKARPIKVQEENIN